MLRFWVAALFLVDYKLIIEFADDGGSINVVISGVFNFREDGPVVVFAFVLEEDAFVDHEFVHFLIPILFDKLYIIIDASIHVISILIIFSTNKYQWTVTQGPLRKSLFLTLTWM